MYSVFVLFYSLFFFFNDTATTEIYTLSLHDALPISVAALAARSGAGDLVEVVVPVVEVLVHLVRLAADRKSTRLNSSHGYISYAVFCLKKKKKKTKKTNCPHKTSIIPQPSRLSIHSD